MDRDSESIKAMETHLAGTLKPVAPSREILRRLRRRIRIPARDEIVDRLHDWQRLWLVLGGVLSGGLAVLTVARAIFHLVGRRQVG